MFNPSGKAMLIIDLQNDYFPGGAFPLWNTEQTVANILTAMQTAKEKEIPMIHVQHIADPSLGLSPFFNKGSEGANIRPEIEKYKSAILPDCSTTVSEMLHLIALHAVSTRMALVPSVQALA